MKKLLTLLLLLPLFVACSKDDDNKEPEDPKQDYTSFTVACETDNFTVYNCVIGYKGSDGVWVRVAALGDIKGKTESKEVKVDYNKVKEVYLFNDYYEDGKYKATARTPDPFTLKENKKNKLIIPYSRSVDTVNKGNPKQYPQE